MVDAIEQHMDRNLPGYNVYAVAKYPPACFSPGQGNTGEIVCLQGIPVFYCVGGRLDNVLYASDIGAKRRIVELELELVRGQDRVHMLQLLRALGGAHEQELGKHSYYR